ncbi:MAG TPA: hypothetical protein PKG88_06295 [Bacteroidales bacterium]|nr:hypothetical protein [Bacteroidales bacterium]HPS72068.1 hypothetical protein [Bacteroidales bacterium]
MKKITPIILLFAIIGTILLSSCEKLDVPSDTPLGIKNKIRAIKSEDVWNPPATIWQYEYNGETVYYIPARCCDFYSELYDQHCNLICHPDGGMSGNGDGICTDFFDTRTNEKLIWRDDRND